MPQVYTRTVNAIWISKWSTRPLSSKGVRSHRATTLLCKMIALLLLLTYRNRDTRFLFCCPGKRLSLLPSITSTRPPYHSFSISNQPISRFENVSEATAFEAREKVWYTAPQISHEKSTKEESHPNTKR